MHDHGSNNMFPNSRHIAELHTVYCHCMLHCLQSLHYTLYTFVERGSSVVECRTRNQVSLGSNPPLLPFGRLSCRLNCINEYLAIDSGGHASDLVVARNCCMARMLPGEAENGVGMNRSVREGKKCKALGAGQRTGYCAI